MDMKVLLLLVCVVATVSAYHHGHKSSNEKEKDVGHVHMYYGPVHHHHHHGKGGDDDDDDDDSSSEEDEKDEHKKGDGSEEEDEEDEEEKESHGGKEDKKSKHPEKVWYFQMGNNYGAYEYLDGEHYLRGLHPDLLAEVCKIAKKKCHYINDIYSNCWNTKAEMEHPGQGLMGHWYDACFGYHPSPERLNSLNFTVPFTENLKASLHVRADDSRTTDDVTGWKIGFVRGWAVGSVCLSRQGSIKGTHPLAYTIETFAMHDDMLEAIQNKQIDAIMTEEAFVPKEAGLKSLSPHFYCATQGLSVMTRYGSPVIEWWNKAFDQFLVSGKYKVFCKDAEEKHGHMGPVLCLS